MDYTTTVKCARTRSVLRTLKALVLSTTSKAHRALGKVRGRDTTQRLLALPPELRDIIWGYLLPSGPQRLDFKSKTYVPVLQLLQINRQFREEALGMYYSATRFEFKLSADHYGSFFAWIDSLGPRAREALIMNNVTNASLYFSKSYKDYDAIKPYIGHLACTWWKPLWCFILEADFNEASDFSTIDFKGVRGLTTTYLQNNTVSLGAELMGHLKYVVGEMDALDVDGKPMRTVEGTEDFMVKESERLFRPLKEALCRH